MLYILIKHTKTEKTQEAKPRFLTSKNLILCFKKSKYHHCKKNKRLIRSTGFQSLNVAVLSIAADSLDELSSESVKLGITEILMLSDADKQVSDAYGVLQWAVASGEPGHTFVLVDDTGIVVWIKDYGDPANPNRTMYVPIDELVQETSSHLNL